ncbi:unnamed protein product, partial [Rotaria socialis]
AFRSNDGLNLSLKGNSVQPPGNASSRPYSARSNSQTRQPTISARTGSARDHRTNTNINSSAR